MTEQLTDKTGAPVTIDIEEGSHISAYTVSFSDDPPVGRAEFIDRSGAEHERIFFHTEVDREFGGRGLAGLSLQEALTDSVRNGLTVVPLCPLFSRHLEKHGQEFLSRGGRFRQPTRADFDFVNRETRGDGEDQ